MTAPSELPREKSIYRVEGDHFADQPTWASIFASLCSRSASEVALWASAARMPATDLPHRHADSASTDENTEVRLVIESTSDACA